MTTFQKYCKVHKQKMLMVTIMTGSMSLSGLVLLAFGLAKQVNIDEGILQQMFFALPLTFVISLFIQRIFNLFIKGLFFSRRTIITIQSLAKICVLYGLVLVPSVWVLIKISAAESSHTGAHMLMLWIEHIDATLAICGYVLHLISGAIKVAREIEEEQDLVV